MNIPSSIQIEQPPVFASLPERLEYVKKMDDRTFWIIEDHPKYAINKLGEIYYLSINDYLKPYQRPSPAAVLKYNTSVDKIKYVVKIRNKEDVRVQKNPANLILDTFTPIPNGGGNRCKVFYANNDKRDCSFQNCHRHPMIMKYFYTTGHNMVIVPGFPNYIMSTSGRFYGLISGVEAFIDKDTSEYLRVSMVNGEIESKPNVHRLLAMAYIPTNGRDPKNLLVIHKNKIRDDNRIDLNDIHGPSTNLAWSGK